ncbi:MAG: hypothetical protein HC849_11420 [Oscillatoriales cyanobacterium RU_3_3]|nr:hypothetical protein [Oscillatoriales cyanobacterium RU_3_3]
MSGLKATALTISGIALWLAPPFLLTRKVPLHNLTTGATLIAGFACCLEARKLALKVAKEEDFEALKERAINADLLDEIGTASYVSEKQRRLEADAILASGSAEVEAKRKELEAAYDNDLHDSASASEHPDYPIYLEVRKAMEAGKSVTWIVENILKMGGRKFADGKAKLEAMLQQFEEEEE